MGSPSVCSHQATGGELYSGIAQSCARLTGQTSGLPQILSYATLPITGLLPLTSEAWVAYTLIGLQREYDPNHMQASIPEFWHFEYRKNKATFHASPPLARAALLWRWGQGTRPARRLRPPRQDAGQDAEVRTPSRSRERHAERTTRRHAC
jgi:hypothetical protein